MEMRDLGDSIKIKKTKIDIIKSWYEENKAKEKPDFDSLLHAIEIFDNFLSLPIKQKEGTKYIYEHDDKP